MLARAIHDWSSRRERPMISLNCAAIPASLVESELFGREKGAYTGALSRQAGRFEAADGSTLFLDEVGELPLEAQGKLLRVLEEGRYERLGSTQTHTTDVRIVAATNRDLKTEVERGRFRQDLFFRLNVYPIVLPPLRDRREDIPDLVWHFVRELGTRMGKTFEEIHGPSLAALQRHPWPGNVRELRNVVERAMIRSNESVLRIETPTVEHPGADAAVTLDEAQRRHIVDALERTGWKVRGPDGAAALLGLKPTTLDSKMRKLDIRRPE
jgi:formate hydrogenlyase transcriptional activator